MGLTEQEQVETIAKLHSLIVEFKAKRCPENAFKLQSAWDEAETAFGVTPQSPDWLNMHFSNWELDLVDLAFLNYELD